MINRNSKSIIQKALAEFPAVVLTGARQVGKSTLARHLWPGATYVTLDLPSVAALAERDPEVFWQLHPAPLIVDEVQYAPALLRHLKVRLDQDRRPGQYLLTGSQGFGLMEGVAESLAGRVAVLELGTLSGMELGLGRGMEGWHDYLWRGGYPELASQPERDRELWFQSYVATYLERDVRSALRVNSLLDFDRFLRAAALRVGQLLSYADLARDLGVAPNTVRSWLSVLQASGLVYLLEPYHRQRRKRLSKAPKLYWRDTGLLTFLLGFRTFEDLRRHALWGAVWENLVVAEVVKLNQQQLRPRPLWAWRTVHGQEVDLLVELGPDAFLALECKASEQPGSEALQGLRGLQDDADGTLQLTPRVVCPTRESYPLGQADAWAIAPVDLAEALRLTDA